MTLNCWGIWGVSAHRVARMRAIAHYLVQADYDIVMLQEVWWAADYEEICRILDSSSTLPWRHFFDQGIIGTGTCILSRAPILEAAFHEFSMNGYPHKVHHADWFAGKGLGVATIDLRGLHVHVFTSHLHAEYCRREDIYLGHRVLQALEAAQWIRLTSAGADLTIYAGDFNTEPGDVPCRLLRGVAGLADAWEEAGAGAGGTCGAPGNSFCTIAEKEDYPQGKRIDFILHRAGRGRRSAAASCRLPLPPTLPAALGAACSYSDHEAVAAELVVTRGHTAPATDLAAVMEAVELVAAAARAVMAHQAAYLLLALLGALALAASFAELLATDSLAMATLTFLLRLLLNLASLYWLLMATIFNRRERHALASGRAALALLQGRQGYGAI